MEDKKLNNVVDVWKTIVDVQKHFNDIEMRIRGIFVTMILGLAAAQGFLMDKGLAFELGPIKILYATFVPILGIVATSLFYFMDRYWYHRLLYGAVKQGQFIEDRYKDVLPELGLTAAIKSTSAVLPAKWTSFSGRIGKWIADKLVTDEKYLKEGELHSDGKIELFYKSVGYLFLFLFLVTVAFIGVLVSENSLASLLWKLVVWTASKVLVVE